MSVRLALLGAGAFGQLHARALAVLPGASLTLVCDPDQQRAEQVARPLRVASTGEIEAALSDPHIDGVVIASPEAFHAAQAETALRAGKHVFVEKPVALTSDDVRHLARVAAENSRVLMPGHILRFVPAYALARQWIVGRPRVHSVFARRNVPAERFTGHQRTHAALMSLTHDLDLLLWYLPGQQPERVYAVERRTIPGAGHPDIFWGLIEFSGGTIACVESLWTIPAGGGRYVDVEIEVAAEDEMLSIRNPDDAVTIITPSRSYHPDTTIDVVAGTQRFGALHAELAHFIAQLQGSSTVPVVTINDALRATVLAEALMRSAQERQVIVLDTDRSVAHNAG